MFAVGKQWRTIGGFFLIMMFEMRRDFRWWFVRSMNDNRRWRIIRGFPRSCSNRPIGRSIDWRRQWWRRVEEITQTWSMQFLSCSIRWIERLKYRWKNRNGRRRFRKCPRTIDIRIRISHGIMRRNFMNDGNIIERHTFSMWWITITFRGQWSIRTSARGQWIIRMRISWWIVVVCMRHEQWQVTCSRKQNWELEVVQIVDVKNKRSTKRERERKKTCVFVVLIKMESSIIDTYWACMYRILS